MDLYLRATLGLLALVTIAALPRPWRELGIGAVVLALVAWAGYELGVADRPIPQTLLNAAARDEAINGG